LRHLVISDIHANLEALEAVLADAGKWDKLLFLGDLVGYGPNPNEVAERLQGLGESAAIVGNHDLAALSELDLEMFNPTARVAAEWTSKEMTPATRTFIGGLRPTGRSLIGEGARAIGLFLAHASPRDPVWEYMEESWQGPPNFERFTEPVALVGHTHVPRVFEEHPERTRMFIPKSGDTLDLTNGPRRIINPGGVGQPRDGNPAAAYGILDDDKLTFTFRRVRYPIEVTQEKILAAGLPRQLAHRLALGL